MSCRVMGKKVEQESSDILWHRREQPAQIASQRYLSTVPGMSPPRLFLRRRFKGNATSIDRARFVDPTPNQPSGGNLSEAGLSCCYGRTDHDPE